MVRVVPVLNILAVVIMMLGVTMSVPLTVSFFANDQAVYAYNGAIVATLAAGAILWFATRHGEGVE